jgi:hypothetical protein
VTHILFLEMSIGHGAWGRGEKLTATSPLLPYSSTPRQWQTFEVKLLNQLTLRLAIAIQQAELYHNLQILNTELEAKVEERTVKLQESDRRFYAIFKGLLTLRYRGLEESNS